MFVTCFFTVNASSYTVKKGSTMILKCTATPPSGGWITHAFFDLVDPNDAQYLGIQYNSSDCCATLYGLKAKSSIKVEVTYAYSYRGTYDNNIHVGHASYTDYITVSGPETSTSFKFREGTPINIPAGGTRIIHVDFYPEGSEPDDFQFGFLSGFGSPFCFDAKSVSGSYDIEISADNRVGKSAIFLGYINNDQNTVKNATLNIVSSDEAVTPKSMKLSDEQVSLVEGDKKKLNVLFDPEDAWAETEFSSSDEKVATVSESGLITAIGVGTATITAKALNLNATCVVTVKPKAKEFSVNSNINIASGYSYAIVPTTTPVDAYATYKLTSSNTNVVTVSGMLIKGIRQGSATITVSSPETGTKHDIQVNVTYPAQGEDVRDAAKRVQAVKNLFYMTIPK